MASSGGLGPSERRTQRPAVHDVAVTVQRGDPGTVQVAQHRTLAALQAIASDVLVERLGVLEHVAHDRLRLDPVAPDPRVVPGEDLERRLEEVGFGLGPGDLFELLHTLLVLDAVALESQSPDSPRCISWPHNSTGTEAPASETGPPPPMWSNEPQPCLAKLSARQTDFWLDPLEELSEENSWSTCRMAWSRNTRAS